MILDEIVETKQREVARRKRAVPLRVLEERMALCLPVGDFKAALGRAGYAIIAEVKRRSPSRPPFRTDFDPVRIAQEYERHGAAAISVLTDQDFFGGSDADLIAIRGAVGLPLLRKEFIIDPYQIHEARSIGADAILLIAAILEVGRLREYRRLAASLGLACLVEVHDRQEMEGALASGAEIIGINNRDLRTFSTDLGTSLALAPLIPKDLVVVAESGIRSRAEVEALAAAGIRAFLIGETLIASPDIGSKLEELLGA